MVYLSTPLLVISWKNIYMTTYVHIQMFQVQLSQQLMNINKQLYMSDQP